MSRFSIWITQPERDSHAALFVDVASSIAASLRRLGHEVLFSPGRGLRLTSPQAPDGDYGRPIIFAPHWLPDVPLPRDAILFNLEQVAGSFDKPLPGTTASDALYAWFSSSAVNVFRRHVVWDYSRSNAERLRALGCERVVHCPIGYDPSMSTIEGGGFEDVDVLFYGSGGPRREAVLNELRSRTVTVDGIERPMRVQHLFGVYGEVRDRWIGRAKVVLNLHANPPEVIPAVWEIVRCSYLMANKKCVVTENGGRDEALEDIAERGCARVPYDLLVDTCCALVESEEARSEVSARGFETITAIDQASAVRTALEAS